MTNEDPVNPNKILLQYLKNIDISSTIPPTYRITYWIGNPGKYFVKGSMNDPQNSFLAYLFTTSIDYGTFGVFKMDFSFTTP